MDIIDTICGYIRQIAIALKLYSSYYRGYGYPGSIDVFGLGMHPRQILNLRIRFAGS